MSRCRKWAVLASAMLALCAAVVARPPQAPPLYDGLGFPDEPYRWVSAPAGSPSTPAPTVAQATVELGAGRTSVVRGASLEQGPQIAFAVTADAFAAPTGDTTVQLSATPRPLPEKRPDEGQVISNLYTFRATASEHAVPWAQDGTLVVNLRVDQATRQLVVICSWSGSRWTQLATRQVGADIYAAYVSGPASIAAVQLDPGARPSVTQSPANAAPSQPKPIPGPATRLTGHGASGSTLWLVFGGFVVLVASALLAIRRRTGDRRQGERLGDPIA